MVAMSPRIEFALPIRLRPVSGQSIPKVQRLSHLCWKRYNQKVNGKLLDDGGTLSSVCLCGVVIVCLMRNEAVEASFYRPKIKGS